MINHRNKGAQTEVDETEVDETEVDETEVDETKYDGYKRKLKSLREHEDTLSRDMEELQMKMEDKTEQLHNPMNSVNTRYGKFR